jgi:hypothetical protein
MRKFSMAHIDADYTAASRVELRKIRQHEFERPGAQLNSLFAPLACGDVFEWIESSNNNAQKKTAVLLANPCDLMLRLSGRRKSKRGWLVPFEKDTRRKIEAQIKAIGGTVGGSILYSLFTGSEQEDIAYLFFNANVDAIELDVLDLCWTNEDGRSSFSVDAAKSQETLLPAQRARLKLTAKRAASNNGFGDIEIFGLRLPVALKPAEEYLVEGIGVSQTIEYPIQRVFQIAPEFSAAALTSLSHSIARPAFNHDYMRVE